MDLALRTPVRTRHRNGRLRRKGQPKFRWLTIPASDDERSSSTLSSMSPKRSSVSSRSDHGTPNSESCDRRIDSEQRASHHQKHGTKSKSHHYEKVAVIDPNAQQKIVYAKCLSPKEMENLSSRSSGKKQIFQFSPTQNGTPHGGAPAHTKTSHSSHKKRQSKELTITDMFDAVRKGDINMLNKFSANEQSETVDERGNTVLHAAADSGQLQCVQILATGSCVDAVSLLNDDMMTPAALSVKNGHLCCVQWLVQDTKAKEELIVSSRQASIDGSNMRPPLAHVAARYDQDVVLDWLCEEMSREKFSIDSADHHSNTAVHEAAAHGRLRCLQTLVSRGASVTVLNSNGDTPGQVADKNGHDLCLGYLVVVETCMSLAQQLITLKMENEEVKKQNETLKTQMAQNITNLRMMRAHSVEERIKATIQNLSPYAEDNDPENRDRIDRVQPTTPRQPLDSQQSADIKQGSVNQIITISQSENIAEVEPQAEDKQQTTSSDQVPTASKPKATEKQSQLFARFATGAKPQVNDAKTVQTNVKYAHAVQAEPVDVNNNDNANTTPAEQKSDTVATAEEPVPNDYRSTKTEGPHVSSTHETETLNKKERAIPKLIEPLQDRHDDQEHNAEIQTLTAGMNGKPLHRMNGGAKPLPGYGAHGSRAWEKMAMDEMLRMARDTRYLPSPTVSMCTEDSTMETREQMRERLAEASRWFLGQQGRGRGSRLHPAVNPTLRKPTVNQVQPTVIRNPSSTETKPDKKTMNSTASWVLGVQKPTQINKGPPTSLRHSIPQHFITATNQQYRKIQLDLQKKQDQKPKTPPATQSHSLPPNVRLIAGPSTLKSPSNSSVSSFSSTTINSPNALELSSSSSASTRPTSAKSSCSSASTVKSNAMNSSSSSVSNSTAASQDTVVENGVDGARWRSNAELVERQYSDPLQKRRTPLASESQSSTKTHSSTNSARSTSARINDAISGHAIGITKAYEDNHLAASETAEVRVNLPPRNNSFLRKIQPSGPALSSHIDSPPSRFVKYNTPASRQSHTVTYPYMNYKSPSPSGKDDYRAGQVQSHVTSSASSPSVKFSTADEIPMHKVEIVAPSGRVVDARADTAVRKQGAVTGRSYVLWKPSTAQVTKHEAAPVSTPTNPSSPPKADKNKKSKHQGSSSAKIPYGGMFSTTNSPKTNSKRKETKLFHF